MQTKKKKSRVWLWVLIAVVVTIVVGLLLLSNAIQRASQPVYVAYTVETGTVERTITGSGRLSAADTATLQLPGDVRVSSVPAKAGDTVKAGDVLATLDVDSLREVAAQVGSDLSTLDRAIKSRGKVTQVKAPVRGRIKYLPAKEGDDVLTIIRDHGALALLSSDDKMQVIIETTAELALYSDVSVRWDGAQATGTVSKKTDSGYLITLNDNGTPYLATAQVYAGETLLGEGQLTIHAPVAVLAAGGKITSVYAKENEIVYYNHKLIAVEDAPSSASYNQSFAERTEKANLYATLLSYIQDPRVIAPVDGLINDVKITENTTVTASSASDGMTDAFVLHTGGAVKLTIDADELDIYSVALGQSANVTLDAYPGESFTAVVTDISRIGTVSGSITTYPVEVTLANDDRLLEGMNGSAVILTSKVENVPVLPVDRIIEDSTGAYVNVKNAAGELVRRDITTGLSNGVIAQITSGLVAGDQIWYLDAGAMPKIPGMNYGPNRMDDMQQSSTVNGGE